MPVQTIKGPALPEILKMIFCQCKKECKGPCTCKKAGLPCSSICGSCESRQCSNYKDSDNMLSQQVELEETLDSDEVVDGVELEGTLDPEEVQDKESDDDW